MLGPQQCKGGCSSDSSQTLNANLVTLNPQLFLTNQHIFCNNEKSGWTVCFISSLCWTSKCHQCYSFFLSAVVSLSKGHPQYGLNKALWVPLQSHANFINLMLHNRSVVAQTCWDCIHWIMFYGTADIFWMKKKLGLFHKSWNLFIFLRNDYTNRSIDPFWHRSFDTDNPEPWSASN